MLTTFFRIVGTVGEKPFRLGPFLSRQEAERIVQHISDILYLECNEDAGKTYKAMLVESIPNTAEFDDINYIADITGVVPEDHCF